MTEVKFWVSFLVMLLYRGLGQQPLCLWLTVTREAAKADITRRSHFTAGPSAFVRSQC